MKSRHAALKRKYLANWKENTWLQNNQNLVTFVSVNKIKKYQFLYNFVQIPPVSWWYPLLPSNASWNFYMQCRM